MARTPNPHSATAQFFINTVNNDFLNFKSQTPSGWGYAVFGKVIKGMEVVDAISKVKTGNQGRFRDVPEILIEIEAIHKAYLEAYSLVIEVVNYLDSITSFS